MKTIFAILAVISVAALILTKYLEQKKRNASAAPAAPSPTEPRQPGVKCKEYLNNTGSTIESVNYIDCSGKVMISQLVVSNQSICAQEGTLSGSGAGYLIELGDC